MAYFRLTPRRSLTSAGPISFLSLQVGDHLVAGCPRAPAAWKKRDSLTRRSRPSATRSWKSSCFSVALDAERGPAPPRGSAARPRRGRNSAVQPVDDALLLGSQPDRVRGQTHLVTLALHDAVASRRGEELGEDLLLRRVPARLRSSSREIPPRERVLARGMPRGAATAWERRRSLASRWTYHSRSTAVIAWAC